MIFNCRQSTADGKVAYWGAELDEDYARLDIHDSYELIYVKSGVCRLNYQAHEIEITAGKAFLLFPNTLHFTQCANDTALAYNIVFPKYLVEEFNEAVKDKCPLNICYEPDEITVKMIYENMILNPCENIVALKAYANLICADFLKKSGLKPCEVSDNSDILQKAIVYIKNNYKNQITLSKVAYETGVSRSYLSRVINQKTGKGFLPLVKAFRLQNALYLIQNTDKKIKDIVGETGYNDERSFYADFKAEFGVSPSVMRKADK